MEFEIPSTRPIQCPRCPKKLSDVRGLGKHTLNYCKGNGLLIDSEDSALVSLAQTEFENLTLIQNTNNYFYIHNPTGLLICARCRCGVIPKYAGTHYRIHTTEIFNIAEILRQTGITPAAPGDARLQAYISTPAALRIAVLKVHDPSFRCSVCPKIFGARGSLRMHYRNTHERAARNEFAIVRSQTFFKFRGLVQYFAVVDSLSEIPMPTDIGDVLNIVLDVKFN
jgi:hypothetical protein